MSSIEGLTTQAAQNPFVSGDTQDLLNFPSNDDKRMCKVATWGNS